MEMPAVYGIALLEQYRSLMMRPSWSLNPYLYKALREHVAVDFISEPRLLIAAKRLSRRFLRFLWHFGGNDPAILGNDAW